jgi:ribonuclease HI
VHFKRHKEKHGYYRVPPHEAECISVLLALEWLSELGLSQVVIESDKH